MVRFSHSRFVIYVGKTNKHVYHVNCFASVASSKGFTISRGFLSKAEEESVTLKVAPKLINIGKFFKNGKILVLKQKGKRFRIAMM